MAVKKYYRSWDELPVMLTIGQCALLFSKNYDTIRSWIAKGILPATQFGKEYRVAKSTVIRMLEGGFENG